MHFEYLLLSLDWRIIEIVHNNILGSLNGFYFFGVHENAFSFLETWCNGHVLDICNELASISQLLALW